MKHTTPTPHTPQRRAVRRRTVLGLGVVVPAALWAGGCAQFGGPSVGDLRLLIPNAPGGGYDVTARIVARILENRGTTGSIDRFNVIGDGGTVALARLMRESGNEHLVAMAGFGVVGAAAANRAPRRLSEATPLARVVDEAEAVVVQSASDVESVDAFVRTWQRDPASVTVGVGSNPGGPDHVFALELARAVGIAPDAVDIVYASGAGELLTAMLDGRVAVGIAGAGEYLDQVRAGSLRLLAVSGAPHPGGAPTLVERGIALEFTNWRGFVAPPGISPDARDRLIDALTDMHGTAEWADATADRGWTDSFVTGAEFGEFLADEERRVDTTLTELGIVTAPR